MHLQETSKLIQMWKHALSERTNIVLMRHAPKAGSNNSTLSPEGELLAYKYGQILDIHLPSDYLGKAFFYHTSKERTSRTIALVFPDREDKVSLALQDLGVNEVSESVQNQCDRLHQEVGRWRGYYLNHTYYFLEQLGGNFDCENINTDIALRMVRGIRKLSEKKSDKLNIYCGHSPSIESACVNLLNMSLSEIGGFLNPLDSLHLRREDNDTFTLVARINPIVDYVDLESETYFSQTL